MNKNLLVKMLCFEAGCYRVLSGITIALALFISPVYSQYCIPSAINGCTTNLGNETISNFLLGTINHNSDCSPTNYYDFFDSTNVITTLVSPSTNVPYTVTALHADYASSYYVAIWIDLDSNGVFDPVNERVALRPTATDCALNLQTFGLCDYVPKSGTLNIPSGVTPGIKRLRVRLIFNDSSIDPCAQVTYGEAEDFRVLITATVSTGNTVSVGTVTPASYCAGSNISVPFTVTGTYNNGNVFTAQLSDSSGNFSSPVTLGTLTSTSAGTIAGVVPSNALHGVGYMIRIISSNPADTSTINSAAITINQAAPVSASIQANPGGTICSGSQVVFTATPVNGGTNPAYQWKVNGSAAGTNSNSFSSSTLHNGDSVVCILTSNAACATGSPFTTGAIHMTVNNASGAGTITAVKDTLCAGGHAALIDKNGSGSIQWQSSVDGNTFTDISSATDTSYSATPAQTTYYRVYTTGGSCRDTSSALQVTVKAQPTPPNITANDTLICSNDSSQLCASGAYSSYFWNTGATTTCTYVNEAGGVWVTGTDAYGCSNTSRHVYITVYPVSSVSIIQEGDTFTTYGGKAYQWLRNDTVIAGATSNIYFANKSGFYSVQLTDTNGCISTSSGVSVSVSGINEISLANDISIYPNPASGTFNIHYTGAASKGLYLTLFNAAGEKIKEQQLNVNSQADVLVNIASLPAGVYLIQLQSGQRTMTQKIIIE